MKNKGIYLLTILLMLVSCQHSVDDDYDYKAIKSDNNIQQKPSDDYLYVSSTSLDFSYNASISLNVTVNSNVSWTAITDANWVKMSQTSDLLTVKPDLNQSYSSRTATITIKGGLLTASITVEQKGASEPSVGEVSVSDITKTSATCAFYFNSSDVRITRYGVCYSPTEKEPTTSNDSKYNSTSTFEGEATLMLSDLAHNTKYYIRPYVVTDIGTTYGSVVQFTTSKINSPNEGDNPTPEY